MPGMDGTGPMGNGPAAGGGRGRCAGGRGRGQGGGRGQCLGRNFDPAGKPSDEGRNLRKELLEKGLEEIKRLLEEEKE